MQEKQELVISTVLVPYAPLPCDELYTKLEMIGMKLIKSDIMLQSHEL